MATFVGLADNRAGIISLNFSGAGLTAGPSNNIFISPAAAASLVIQTPPYSSVTAGNPLTDPIVIDEEDQYGNIETGDNSTVVTGLASQRRRHAQRHDDRHRRRPAWRRLTIWRTTRPGRSRSSSPRRACPR